MGKIVVLESDKRQIENLKVLLSSLKTEHVFFYANSPVQAINLSLSKKADVILCSIDSLGQVAIDFIDYISFVIPNIVCIYISDCRDAEQTILCLNRRKPFSFIVKPFESIKDISLPIENAVKESKRLKAYDNSSENIDEELMRLTENLKKMQFIMQYNKAFYFTISKILSGLLVQNSIVSSSTKNIFKTDYVIKYVQDCFEKFINYHILEEQTIDKKIQSVKKIFNKPDYNCKYVIGANVGVDDTDYSLNIMLALYFLANLVSSSVIQYDIMALVSEDENQYTIVQKVDACASLSESGKVLYKSADSHELEGIIFVTKIFLNCISEIEFLGNSESPFEAKIYIKKEK